MSSAGPRQKQQIQSLDEGPRQQKQSERNIHLSRLSEECEDGYKNAQFISTKNEPPPDHLKTVLRITGQIVNTWYTLQLHYCSGFLVGTLYRIGVNKKWKTHTIWGRTQKTKTIQPSVSKWKYSQCLPKSCRFLHTNSARIAKIAMP